MTTSYDLERALKRAHSGFWILRHDNRPTFPARIFWYGNEICACPKGEIPPKTIKDDRHIIDRGLDDILRVLESNAFMGYNFKKVEKSARKLC